MVEVYGWTDAAANMVYSYMLFVFVFGILVGGIMQDRTSPRLVAAMGCVLFSGGILLTSMLTANSITWIYLTYSVVSGLGCGMVYVSALSCIQKCMPESRGLASGLASAAFGLSTVVFTPLSRWMICWYGVVCAFRTLAGVFFVIGVIACWFIKVPPAHWENQKDCSAELRDDSAAPAEVLHTVRFWYIFLYVMFVSINWNLVNPRVQEILLGAGIDADRAMAVLSMTGIASVAGRLLLPALSDWIGRVKCLKIICVTGMATSLAFIFGKGHIYTAGMLLAVAAYGASGAISPAIMSDVYGPRYSGTNIGLMSMALGMSSIIFNWIAARFFYGELLIIFIMACVTSIIALAFTVMLEKTLGQAERNVKMKEVKIWRH